MIDLLATAFKKESLQDQNQENGSKGSENNKAEAEIQGNEVRLGEIKVQSEDRNEDIRSLKGVNDFPGLFKKTSSNKNNFSGWNQVSKNIGMDEISPCNGMKNFVPASSKLGRKFTMINQEFFKGRDLIFSKNDSNTQMLKCSYLSESTDLNGFEALKQGSDVNGLLLEVYRQNSHGDIRARNIEQEDKFWKIFLEREKQCKVECPKGDNSRNLKEQFGMEEAWSKVIQGISGNNSVASAIVLLARYDQLFKTHYVKDIFVQEEVNHFS